MSKFIRYSSHGCAPGRAAVEIGFQPPYPSHARRKTCGNTHGIYIPRTSNLVSFPLTRSTVSPDIDRYLNGPLYRIPIQSKPRRRWDHPEYVDIRRQNSTFHRRRISTSIRRLTPTSYRRRVDVVDVPLDCIGSIQTGRNSTSILRRRTDVPQTSHRRRHFGPH